MRCGYCYLTKEQLSDRRVLPLNETYAILSKFDKIHRLEIYGGEVALLDKTYIEDIIERYNHTNITIITNGTIIKDWMYNNDIELVISLDFHVRERFEEVLKNIIMLPRQVSINILVTPELLERDILKDIALVESISNISHVDLKPYSPNQSNNYNLPFIYEQYVSYWIQHSTKEIVSKKIIDSEDYRDKKHIFITPNGKCSILKFDNESKEYFYEFEYTSIDEIFESEYDAIEKSNCNECNYKYRCLTEHYKPSDGIQNPACSGFKILIESYIEYERRTVDGQSAYLPHLVSERIRKSFQQDNKNYIFKG